MLTYCTDAHSPQEFARQGAKMKKLIAIRTADVRDKYDLNQLEMDTVMLIGNSQEGLVLSDLCTFLNVNKGQESCAVNSLVEKGLLLQKRDTHDRRYIRLALSSEGVTVFRETGQILEALRQRMFSGISEEEKRALLSLSEKVYSNLRNEMEKVGLK